MMILVNIDMKAPLHPDETFFLKKRSCEICLGCRLIYYDNKFAARFVSGYYYFDMEEPLYELHAWVEVFLPGLARFRP
jgi:hypothetical protein